MERRLQLQTLFKSFGFEQVYFQEPSDEEMVYPCIVYHIDDEITVHADNVPYNQTMKYQVTVIVEDPDDPLRKKVSTLPMCTMQRFFIKDGLNHFVYELYF